MKRTKALSTSDCTPTFSPAKIPRHCKLGTIKSRDMIRNPSRLIIRKGPVHKDLIKTPALNKTISLQNISKSSLSLLNLAKVVRRDQSTIIFNTLTSITCSPSSDSERDTQEISSKIGNDLFEQCMLACIDTVASTSVKEMLSATLQIIADLVTEKFLKEAVEAEVKCLVENYKIEFRDEEYAYSQEMIIELVCLEILDGVAKECTQQRWSEDIFQKYLDSFEVLDVVEQAIAEEKQSASRIPNLIIDDLVSCILNEDWIEAVVEDEISYKRINDNYKLFPLKLQKKIARKNARFNMEKVIEEVYFDLIHDFVAGLWTENIVFDAVQRHGSQASYEQLMPIKINQYRLRRQYSMFINVIPSRRNNSYL